jgi:uncharacterized protein YqiB (DUF1249 family)
LVVVAQVGQVLLLLELMEVIRYLVLLRVLVVGVAAKVAAQEAMD